MNNSKSFLAGEVIASALIILAFVPLINASAIGTFPGFFWDNVTNLTITVSQNSSQASFNLNTIGTPFDNQIVVFSGTIGSGGYTVGDITQSFSLSGILNSVDGNVSIAKGNSIPKFISLNLHPQSPWDFYLPLALSSYNMNVSQINNDCLTNGCSIFNNYLVNHNITIPSDANINFTKSGTSYAISSDSGYGNASTYRNNITHIITDSVMQMNISTIISDILPMITNNLTYLNYSVSQPLLNSLNIEYYLNSVDLSNVQLKNGSYVVPITISNGTLSYQKNVYLKIEGVQNALNVTLDTTPPVINITSPQNSENYTNQITEINYTATDDNLESCWYSLNQGVTNTTTACNTIITGISSFNGENTWTVYANDTAGNQASESVTFFFAENSTNSTKDNSTGGNNGGGGTGTGGGGGTGGGSGSRHSSRTAYIASPINNPSQAYNSGSSTGKSTITALTAAPLNSNGNYSDFAGIFVIISLFTGLGIFLAIVTFSSRRKKVRL